METFIECLKTIVRQRMKALEGTAHSYEHVERVFKIADFVAVKEGANAELVQAGAILHDVGWSVGQPHNETGARLAKEILEGINYPEEKAARVTRIVLNHPIGLRDRLETLEEKVVWDADKIDLLGAVGIVRGVHWHCKRSFEDVLKLAHQMLTPIYDMLNTTTAKEISERRHKETVSVLSALDDELSLTDLCMGQHRAAGFGKEFKVDT